MPTTPRDHDWIRQHLSHYAAGILDSDDAEQVEQHLEGCRDCRESLAGAGSGREDSSPHLPDDLISHWAERRWDLRGLQRELVRRHLGRCDECRRILQQLGHEPEIERVAALEPSRDLLLQLEGGQGKQILELPRPYWMRREFWVGSMTGGLVAAAAALVLIVNPALRPGPTSPAGEPVIGAPGEAPAPAPEIPPLTIEFSPPPVQATLHGPIRGETTRARIAVTRETRTLELSVEPPDVPDGATVIVSLERESGAPLIRETRPVEEFFRQRRLVFHSQGSFEPGPYRLRISGTGADTLEVATYRFEIVLAAER